MIDCSVKRVRFLINEPMVKVVFSIKGKLSDHHNRKLRFFYGGFHVVL